MTKFTPVAGTNAAMREDSWHLEQSLFSRFMETLEFEWNGRYYGFWSTALAGTWFTQSKHLVWQFSARELRDHLNAMPFGDRNVFGHSWGGAVIAYCLADPKTLPVRSVVTVDTPLQRSLDPIWLAGVKKRAYHEHLYSKGWGSRIRFVAQRGRFLRTMPWATRNTNIVDGHSGMLHRAKHMEQFASVAHRVKTFDVSSAIPVHGMGTVGSE